MFLLPQRRIWTQQPQELTEIDWGNPLTRDLLVAATPLHAVGGIKYVTPWGLACRDAKLDRPVMATVQNSTVFIIDVQVGVDGGTFWQANENAYADSSSVWPYAAGLRVLSAKIYGKMVISATNTANALVIADVDVTPDGNFSGYLARAATVDSNLLVAAWGNGRKIGTSIGLQGHILKPVLKTSAVAAFGIQAPVIGDTVTAQTLVLRWQRVLSDEELLKVFSNPWQIFKAPDSRIFVPTGASAPTNVTLTAAGISTSPATLGTPPLAQNHVLTGAAISASVVLGTPAIVQIHTLTATTISTTPTLGTPALTVVAPSGLTAQDISTQPATLGTPLLNQAHVLAASGIAASPAVLGTPAITQKHVLIATAISTRPVLGTPVLTQVAPGMLSAQSITTAPAVLGTPALAQNHVLSAGAIAAGPPTFTPPTLSQQHAMLAQWITTGAVVLGRPVLSDGHEPILSVIPVGRRKYTSTLRNTLRPADAQILKGRPPCR